MSVDWNKPIQTSDGRKAEYVGEGKNPEYPHIIEVQNPVGNWGVIVVNDEGVSTTSYTQIINVPDPAPAPVGDEVVTMYAPVVNHRNGVNTFGTRLYSHDDLAWSHDAGQSTIVIGVAEIRVRMRKCK